MIERATRSFGEEPAPFRNSHFAKMRVFVAVERDFMRMSGVLPMVDSMPMEAGGR